MKSYDVIIIGGGVIGTAIAYELSKIGVRNVALFEKSYLSSGSTGRCGAGVRQQWGLKFNALLAKKSVDIFEKLSDELGIDIEFRQGGYLVLAHTDHQIEQFEKNVALQNSLGIPSRFVDKAEAKAICPPLNTDKFLAATFCQTDGHANPFLTTFAYASAAQRNGITIRKHTEVTGIFSENGAVRGVEIAGGEKFYAPVVVNAAGPWSKETAALAGIDLPTYPERHQILVTEPVEKMFETMVISFQIGIYLQQVPHGSFVLGIGEKEHPSHNIDSNWQFLEFITHELLELLPVMEKIRVVRQWAGSYERTPDSAPILGEHPQLRGFYNATGFSGHGFMLAPMTGRVMAQQIAGLEPELDVSPLSVERFARGEFIVEPSVVG